MQKNPKSEPDDKEQSQRFIDTAKELDADKNSDTFDKALGILIPQKNQSKQDDV